MIVSGKQQRPHFILIHGTEGVGKSSFIAAAPKPLFIQSENGTGELDVDRYGWGDDNRTVAQSWPELIEALDWLLTASHDFKTVGLDTLDGFEPLAWQWLLEKYPTGKSDLGFGEKSIEGYGYGKGYRGVIDVLWLPQVMTRLEKLRDRKGMNIIISAHSGVKTFKNPVGEDFDRYEVKCQKDLSGLFREKAETVLFADYEIFAVKGKGERKAKGIGDAARIMHTEKRPAWDAKNRFGLPADMPLDWNEFERLARGESAADVVARIMAIEVDGKLADKRAKELAAAGSDVEKLRRFENWLKSKAVKVDGNQ